MGRIDEAANEGDKTLCSTEREREFAGEAGKPAAGTPSECFQMASIDVVGLAHLFDEETGARIG